MSTIPARGKSHREEEESGRVKIGYAEDSRKCEKSNWGEFLRKLFEQ